MKWWAASAFAPAYQFDNADQYHFAAYAQFNDAAVSMLLEARSTDR